MFSPRAVDWCAGRPRIDFLDNSAKWKEKLTVSNILLAMPGRKKMEVYMSPLSENIKIRFM